ncbi:hypothetical protein THAOC_34472 [Thalassiosira oceanica]|uniref:Uncharacterized protein n=1 Tax=Thalassiosira oceanica TaxID=159749 RepID=K0RCP0_THAOC|nr:hypothetical protein THAOC_34472 [Thalassiosira oceanica]|eukprot:EJK46841.1 hypothetical protein THAOC_34472 [Thalassiosira oceanica]
MTQVTLWTLRTNIAARTEGEEIDTIDTGGGAPVSSTLRHLEDAPTASIRHIRRRVSLAFRGVPDGSSAWKATNDNGARPPPIASLTVEVFDSTAITLSTDLSVWEQALVQPLAGAYNSYAFAVGYTEVLSGLRKRMRNRLTSGNGVDWLAPLITPGIAGSDDPGSDDSRIENDTTLEDIAARSSLIFSLSRPKRESPTFEGEMESVASIELRLQPTDAKIPFSQPWLDKLERRLARVLPFTMKEDCNPSKGVAPLRPYLCNLCVSPSLRSLGVGRALCRRRGSTRKRGMSTSEEDGTQYGQEARKR